MSTPSSSPSSPSATPANLLSLQNSVQQKIDFYCQDQRFKESFDKLSGAVKANNALSQPLKLVFGAPVMAGFFANFIALYTILKLYSVLNSDRVKYPGSVLPVIKPTPIQAFVNIFEDSFVKSFKFCGFDTEPLRIRDNGDIRGFGDDYFKERNLEPIKFSFDANQEKQVWKDLDWMDNPMKNLGASINV